MCLGMPPLVLVLRHVVRLLLALPFGTPFLVLLVLACVWLRPVCLLLVVLLLVVLLPAAAVSGPVSGPVSSTHFECGCPARCA